jgi:hypothetical protein
MNAQVCQAHDAKSGPSAAALPLALFAALGMDLALIYAAIAGQAPLASLLMLHVLVGPAVWLATKGDGGATLPSVALVAITVMGPVGGLGTLLLAAHLAWQGNSQKPIRDWQQTLSKSFEGDLPQRLSQAIAEGRLFEPGQQSDAASFQQIANDGSVAQRYAMLGLVSQRFDPSFMPALRQALKSEVSAVRVSAAAVFSKLRDKNRLQMMKAQPMPDLLTLQDATKHGLILARGVASGLLDPLDLAAARKRSLNFLLLARPEATVADELEEIISTLLFDSGSESTLDERLSLLDAADSQVIRRLKARLHMRAGRHEQLLDTIRPRSASPVRLNSIRPAGNGSPLLSALRSDSQ